MLALFIRHGRDSRSKSGVLKDAYVPAIHVFLVAVKKDVDARHTRAFTPVCDGLWPGMTLRYRRARTAP